MILKPKLKPLTNQGLLSERKIDKNSTDSQYFRPQRMKQKGKGAQPIRKTLKNASKSMYTTPKKLLLPSALQTIDSYLKPVFKQSEISHLNLSGCNLLTGKTLDYIIDFCPNISTLVLMSIKQISDDLTKVAEMQRLVHLTTLNLA